MVGWLGDHTRSDTRGTPEASGMLFVLEISQGFLLWGEETLAQNPFE